MVVGATKSTLQTVKGLFRNRANMVGVFSLDYSESQNVSGFSTFEIESFCKEKAIFFKTFKKINNPETIESIRGLEPDLLFAVGFSQLVGDELLAIPKKITVGFSSNTVT